VSNLYVISGDAYGESGSEDRRLLIAVTNAGVAVDLTGVTLTWLVKRRRSDDDADALITKTTTDGIELASPQSGATKGKAYITLEEGDTDDLEGRFLWELEADDAVGKLTLASGRFYVTPDLVTAP
jgi:hypothetical protein